MAVDYQFRRGVDFPQWQWLRQFISGPSYHGSSNVYDGKRYIYWAIQYATTSAAASTTWLMRYCTWSDGWQFLSVVTSGANGLDLEYDNTRNVLWYMSGISTTTMGVFNLNTTAVTVANQSIPAFTYAALTLALPVAGSTGASLTMPDDNTVPAQIDNGIAASAGNTTTTVKATDASGTFGSGMVGLYVRVTSGTQSGQRRVITAVTDKNTVTVAPALPGALATDDTYVIEMPSGTATAGTTTTLTDSGAAWTVNQYANHDVVITSGTGSGQRRRIASNTATVLTLSAAVTGNSRTGPFSPATDATSQYRIVPSADFIYFQPGNGTTSLYKLDVVQTTGSAWSAALATAPGSIGGGGNTFYPGSYAPSQIIAFRGNGTAGVLSYNVGLNTWQTLTTYAGGETFTTGATAAMLTGKRKMFVQKEISQRCYVLDLLTGVYEPFAQMPYAAPGAYDGKRARFVKTADGVEWLYLLRAGGQEFFRVPLEWL